MQASLYILLLFYYIIGLTACSQIARSNCDREEVVFLIDNASSYHNPIENVKRIRKEYRLSDATLLVIIDAHCPVQIQITAQPIPSNNPYQPNINEKDPIPTLDLAKVYGFRPVSPTRRAARLSRCKNGKIYKPKPSKSKQPIFLTNHGIFRTKNEIEAARLLLQLSGGSGKAYPLCINASISSASRGIFSVKF